ncbi:YkgJ family cysteine cluster protein [Desulfovibrio intestinalis]|uniref:Fe-S-cluster containining protein n=1 Tax=Desulfovibrio intestinalis TaxID=58621 RepID=A0A7W8FHY8_9BACT|nr:YkgJ family cysteine cluster protein [Desulfovibrio intestinalis]MBB5144332.1 Fe-S-cluster containining protein [Desulfovibrio intestinalis]
MSSDHAALFHCSRCGACCSHLKEFGELYGDLDDGHGVCIFYDKGMHSCRQYIDRPLKCRVVESYVFFKEQMAFKEYCRINKQGCAYLQTLS